MKYTTPLFSLLIAFVALCTAHVVHANTIGASPSQVVNPILLPGSSYSTSVHFSRSTVDEDAVYYVSLSGTAAEYITLPIDDRLEIPAGEDAYELQIDIAIPEDAELGTYEGLLLIEQFKERGTDVAGESQSVVLPAVGIQIQLTVQDEQVTEYTIPFVTTLPTSVGEQGYVFYRVQNSGNQPVAPDSLDIRVQNIDGEELLVSELIDLDITPVEPFSEKLYVVAFDHGLDPASYTLKTEFTDAGSTVGEPVELVLDVFEQVENTDLGAVGNISFTEEESGHAVQIRATAAYTNESRLYVPIHIVSTLKSNGSLVDVVDEYVPVQPEETVDVEQFIYAVAAGDYTIDTVVSYPGGAARQASYEFSISRTEALQMQNAGTESTRVHWYILFAALIVWLVGTIAYVAHYRKTYTRTVTAPSKKVKKEE